VIEIFITCDSAGLDPELHSWLRSWTTLQQPCINCHEQNMPELLLSEWLAWMTVQRCNIQITALAFRAQKHSELQHSEHKRIWSSSIQSTKHVSEIHMSEIWHCLQETTHTCTKHVSEIAGKARDIHVWMSIKIQIPMQKIKVLCIQIHSTTSFVHKNN
jgi:hypothetical protein